jgi:hypothetical protein
MESTGMLILITVVSILIYLIPSFIGSGHKNSTAILFLNLLLGWTFIGWAAALIWALSDGKKEAVHTVTNNHSPASISEEIAKLHDLKEKGVLSESEFNEAKMKIIK